MVRLLYMVKREPSGDFLFFCLPLPMELILALMSLFWANATMNGFGIQRQMVVLALGSQIKIPYS
jgi:hypothetical protein